MLFKDENNYKIHRIRVIHIYEADYNLILAVKWRQALYHAEKLNWLNPGQYGSRPRRNAWDPVFLEVYQTEISRASRKSLIQTNYDASSCYDRIIPNLAALVSQKFGVASTVVLVNTRTLEKAQYKIRTELGLSDSGYQHCMAHPIYGTGQGSSNSPIIWCFISSVLFDSYESQATGAIYETPDRTTQIKLFMLGFVDDSNGQTNNFLSDIQPTPSELVRLMQSDAQLWNDVLQVSGGALELPKCCYHVLHWEFRPDGTPFLSPGTLGEPVKVTTYVDSSHISSEATLLPLSVSQSHKTLGTYQTPNGDMTSQLRALKTKAEKFANLVKSSYFTRQEAWTFYFAIFLPSLSYPLATSHFTPLQLIEVHRIAMPAIFSKCGYNQKTKKEILYGPVRLGGAGFRDLSVVQGISQLTTFVRHWRKPDSQAGKLVRIAVAWMQFIVGTGIPLLYDTHTLMPHLESQWIKSLRDFLARIQAKLDLAETFIPSIPREKDAFIMDLVLQSGTFTNKEVQRINYCRLYLQAMFLSDISTPSGRQVDMRTLEGRRPGFSAKSRWHRLNQAKPSATSWRLWRKANLIWSTSGGWLRQPLGKWTIPVCQQRMMWPAYYDGNILHVRNSQYSNDQQTIYDPYIRSSHSQIEFRRAPPQLSESKTIKGQTCDLPNTAYPVIVTPTPQGWEVEETQLHHQHACQFTNNIAPQLRQSFPQVWDTSGLSMWEQQLFEGLQFLLPLPELLHRLMGGFSAASDGSVSARGSGSFGWIISFHNGLRAVSCNGTVSGGKLTSYRSEGSGLVSLFSFLNRLSEMFDVPLAAVAWECACDNLAIVQAVQWFLGKDPSVRPAQQAQPLSEATVYQCLRDNSDQHDHQAKGRVDAQRILADPTAPDWDILIELQGQVKTFSKCEMKHVRGHQDRKRAYDTLPLLSQLNVDADALAGEYHQRCGDYPRPKALLAPSTHLHCHLESGTITASWKNTLRNSATTTPLLRYLQEKNQWSEDTMSQIQWKTVSQCMSANIKRQSHFVKLSHDLLPVNTRLHRFDPTHQPWCPLCLRTGQCPETRDHLLRCASTSGVTWRTQFLKALQLRTDKLHTDPMLRQILLQGFRNWFEGADTPLDLLEYPLEYHELIRTQQLIGWRQWFNGRITTQWDYLQLQYISRLPEGHPGKQRRLNNWGTIMVKLVWQKWLQLWKTRNEVIHGKDRISAERIRMERLHKELRELYARRQLLEPSVASLLLPTLEEHCQQPPAAIHNWFAVHRTLFDKSIRAVQERSVLGVRSLHTYFTNVLQRPLHPANDSRIIRHGDINRPHGRPTRLQPTPLGPGYQNSTMRSFFRPKVTTPSPVSAMDDAITSVTV